MTQKFNVAYFTLEIMLETDIPSYAGGLGVLAGDVLRSCADIGLNALGVTLVYSGSTFDQIIHPDGNQVFKKADWQKADQLMKLKDFVDIEIAGVNARIEVWRYDIVGIDGHIVPVYLLDTDCPKNPEWIRNITKNLYDSSANVRICQEIVLGIGGIKMLRKLGYKKEDVLSYHMNEGHSAFVPLALLPEYEFKDEEVRKKAVFTTHTPVPEGHDKFSYSEANQFASPYLPWHIKTLATTESLNMSYLAINESKAHFAVSEKHKKTSESIFPGINFDYVTNGIHPRTWVSPPMQDLFNEYLPDWDKDPSLLRWADEKIPSDALWASHVEAKKELLKYVNTHLTSISSEEERENPSREDQFDLDTLTISLARRPVAYKRPLLLYTDLHKFMRLGVGKIQIIQCGKSHPGDDVSQSFVREIVKISKKLRTLLKIVYLENYSPKIARLLVGGSDVWLNTPRRPLEASGTSGMKATINGVINFSVLDGWWIEGYRMCKEAGFSIGQSDENAPSDDASDANDLYEKLQTQIIPMYYDHRTEWIKKMKKAITLGAYFNTHRVAKEYLKKAWF